MSNLQPERQLHPESSSETIGLQGLRFEDLKQAEGSVVKLHTPYHGRGSAVRYIKDYARVGKTGQFHDRDPHGNEGIEMHMEVVPMSGHGIRIVTKGQIDREETIVTATTLQESSGKEFAFEQGAFHNIAKIQEGVRSEAHPG